MTEAQKRPAKAEDLKPGDRIPRTGIVWDRGPGVAGASVTCWVTPDAPLRSDIYCVILVGSASSKSVLAHGNYIEDAGSSQYVKRGSLYSSNYVGSPTGRATRNGRPK